MLGRELTCQVSETLTCGGGDEGAEIAEGSRVIRVEVGECPERAQG
jgi:hypothetical protein